MHVRFLCGPAGSGKTFRCLSEIRESLLTGAEGPPLLFIAPKQSTFQLERQLLADGRLSGYTRLHILSFDRLADLVFEKLNVAPPEFLNEEGRVMVLRALLLRHENELKLFRGSARRSGFPRELSRLLAEFQQHHLSAAGLSALAGRPNLRPQLRNKLHDLALLLDRYSSWLGDSHLQDGTRLLDGAADLLRTNSEGRRLSFAALWLDGFAEMTPQELDLLAVIVPFCGRATLAFCLEESGVSDGDVSWLSIWNAVGRTFRQCRHRLEQLPDCKFEVELLRRDPAKGRFARSAILGHLERRWEGAGNNECPDMARSNSPGAGRENEALRIVACQNPEGEAILAAREILKFVRAGNRFRDCAVLVRDLEPYHKTLARTFRRYGIPFFLDRRESIAHHPLAELTRNALRVVAFDWRHEDWFAALKAGFCPVDESDVDWLENESLARGWRGKRWREPIQIPDDLVSGEKLERLRQTLVPPFELFYEAMARSKFHPNGRTLADLLRKLWIGLRVPEVLESWNAGEPETSGVFRRPAVHLTAWDQMNLWLDNIELAFSNETMNIREWLPVLDAGLANLTVGVIPPALDEVLIGAVDRARNPELKFSLILGANDTVFPATPSGSAILTETDRDELNQIVSLGPDLRDRLARERYYGYIAFSRASARMLVSFSRCDSNGRALNPSPFVARLRTLFPQLQIEKFEGCVDSSDIESANELIPTLIEIEKGGQRTARTPDFLKESPTLSGLGQSLAELREPDPREMLSPGLAERLYGKVLRTSVSRLEEYAQCPFKFLVRSGLKAGERKIFELDARERGTFQHDVLKTFHERLVAENKRWRDLTPLEARQRVGQIAAFLEPAFRGGLLRDSAQTRFEARVMTESLQNFVEVLVSWMREQYSFDPAAVELDFGEANSPLPAWRIALTGGHELALRGRIDRVDLCRRLDGQDGLAVVLDYKSSGKKLDAVLVDHGVQLQLAAYLSALTQMPDIRRVFGVERLVPAGVFYVNLRGEFENGKTRGEVLGREGGRSRAAYRHAGRFDSGILEKLDSAGAADQFNYSLNQNGSLRKSQADPLGPEEFRAWLGRVETQLRRIGDEIFSGRAQVDPYRKGSETPCDYCDYSAACRVDPWTHRFRVLKAKTVSTE